MLTEVCQKLQRPANIPNLRQPNLSQRSQNQRNRSEIQEGQVLQDPTKPVLKKGQPVFPGVVHEAKSRLKDKA